MDLRGIFPTLSWDGVALKKIALDEVDSKGRTVYSGVTATLENEEWEEFKNFSEAILDIACPLEENDDDVAWTGYDSSNMSLFQVMEVFRGVSTPEKVRKALRIFFLFNNTEYNTGFLSKYHRLVLFMYLIFEILFQLLLIFIPNYYVIIGTQVCNSWIFW